MKSFLKIFILPFFIFCFQNKTIAQCWNNGDFTSYDQSAWGDPSTTAASNLNNNYNTVYVSVGDVEIGIPGSTGFSMRFDAAPAVIDYLPSVGTPAALNADLFDPVTSNSGQFGGDVLALRLNIDFSDAGFLAGNAGIKFGDLVIYGLTNNTDLNGLTIRQFLNIVNTALGGGSTTDPISDLDAITIDINNSFSAGTASTFAQQHLRKGWKSGDFTSYNQNNWGNGGSGNSILISHYGTVYASTAGGFLIGGLGGYTALWTDVSILSSYLPAVGGAAALTTNFTDGISTSSGLFGGDVAALKLNIDYADAGFLNGTASFHFGDLVLYGFTDLTDLNGKTVREFLQTANTALGGGATTYTIIDIDLVLTQLNISFFNGTPSAWAQLHLKRGWQNGDLTTYPQSAWGNGGVANNILNNNYVSVYTPTNYIFQIGSSSGFTAQWTDVTILSSYLPSNGSAQALTMNTVDGTFTSSGIFGGRVAALKLNIDFSDANVISGNSKLKFGDLTICGLTSNTDLNGKTVRQLLDICNTALSGSSSPYTINDLNDILDISASFASGTYVSQWAQLHLVNGSCDCGNTVTNHCPTASAINISTTVGSAVKFLLQGSDADNNTLTYSISQAPVHGTATIVGGDSIRYTPASGYHGADQLKYKVSDGQCDAEATVNITVVVCPGGQGYWKNNKAVWPVTALMLGTISYTQAQLIKILNTAVGSGNNADASLILADQLIPAKLSVANGSPDPGHLADSIAAADALIGGNLIPMKVKPNTALGKRMTALASYFSSYNSGAMTQGCSQPMITDAETETEIEQIPEGYRLEQNYPNPFGGGTIIRYQLPAISHVKLEVFNLLGEKVATLVDEEERAGSKTVPFNAINQSNGVYYYRLTADKFSETKKMVLMK